jgi:hypothetical protein
MIWVGCLAGVGERNFVYKVLYINLKRRVKFEDLILNMRIISKLV